MITAKWKLPNPLFIDSRLCVDEWHTVQGHKLIHSISLGINDPSAQLFCLFAGEKGYSRRYL